MAAHTSWSTGLVKRSWANHNVHMSIRAAVTEIPEDTGIAYLRDYYSPQNPSAYFESVDADNNLRDKITGSDLFAVVMLETPIDAQAGLGILVTEAAEITQLLRSIPSEPLHTLSPEEFDEHLGPDSAAAHLWSILVRQEGIGEIEASKILARKRPHLLPLYDSVVKRVINQQPGDNAWQLWWEALTVDDYLESRAETLRRAIDRPELSTLRLLDVLLWYSGEYGLHTE